MDAPDSPLGAWMPLPDAAHRLGLSVVTLRRRIKRGELAARKVPTRHGEAYEVLITPEQADQARVISAQGQHGASSRQADQPTTQATTQATGQVAAPEGLSMVTALELIRDLQHENVQLAGQVGYFQARVQDLETRLLALEAPRESHAGVDAAERVHSAILTASGAETPQEPSTGRTRPWWRFWG